MSKNHIMTYPGLKFLDPFQPDPEQITIEDIAHSLGMLCRYGGHVPRFYSVAEHCVLLADAVFAIEGSFAMAFAALMDDAPEAYIGDMLRPVKQRLVEYRSMDDQCSAIMRKQFGVNTEESMLDSVSHYDFRLLRTEMTEMFGDKYLAQHFPHIHEAKVLPGVELEYWSPVEAKDRFLDAFDRYGSG